MKYSEWCLHLPSVILERMAPGWQHRRDCDVKNCNFLPTYSSLMRLYITLRIQLTAKVIRKGWSMVREMVLIKMCV